jgi:Heparinase II/III-like protein
LIDPGTFVYSAARPWRDFFRSTPAHNTIAVDEQDQAVRVNWFKWRGLPQVTLEKSVSLAAMDYAVASHNGYARLAEPVLHRRHVVFSKPDYWFITDELSGQGQHRIEVFFHFAPEVSVARTEHGWLATKGSEQFLLIPLCHGVEFRIAAGETSPIQGWHSMDYGHREPACVLVGEIDTTLPACFRWLLFPIEDNLPGLQGVSGDGCAISVMTDQWTDSIAWHGSAEGTSHGQISTDAALAIVRRGNTEARDRITLLGGSTITDGSNTILSAARPVDHFVAEWSADCVDIVASPTQGFRLHSDFARSVRVNGKPAKCLEDGDAVVFEGEN